MARRFAPLLLALVLLTLLLPRFAAASRPVIVPGREHEILALFDPYELGDELAPGWTLHSFAIDTSTIELRIAGPEPSYARLALDHPEHPGHDPDDARQLEGFTLTILEQPPGSAAAVAELVATIQRNDDGAFWRERTAYADDTREPIPAPPLLAEIFDRVVRWASDGLLLLAAFTLALVSLTAHKLRGGEPWMKWCLLAIVLVGAALRIGLSPQAPLAPWSYTRFLASARLIYEGPLLAIVHPEPVWMSETIMRSTLALSLLAPLAVYVHARYLLADHRAALVVAGILAFLPLHLRFSHTDAAFIPSITVSSFLFTLIHVATREQDRWLAWAAVAAVGFPLALVYVVRPLNMMYFPLLVATVFVNHGIERDKPPPNWWRTGAVFVIIAAVTFLGGVPWLLASFDDKIREGLDVATLVSAAKVVLSPRMNALLNPTFTPPGLLALAIVGAVDLWQRGRRRLAWFLAVWLLGFLVGHAYFVPMSPYMQARYHLHLIVPFMLLAACGFEAALRWLANNRTQRAWLAGRREQGVIAAMIAYIVASPLIHLHAVRYVAFNEVREWRFVHSLRDAIPRECTIIEYVGIGADSRFDRVGSYVEAGTPQTSWRVLEIPLAGHDPVVNQDDFELPEEVRAVLEDPPDCLYWYEGLPCFAYKPTEQPAAMACQLIEGFVALEQVAGTSFASVPYDESLFYGLGHVDPIELRLFRVHPRGWVPEEFGG
ncbi:hypothetical protein DB30_07986 [Enhygromyxa salina]|uniref:Glycosyltransferase RgtA/B/C/D-like domain-containing protein n=1 Tax=Enhygromyxa salina TaxID=215803 RepID=A0A0C1ZRA2_9BACT|nr:hypothetical protein [Enhygromyxa salina]KIG13538.1 hypothetical protein DB30_07986 [Enhygromyxa salina]